MAFTPRALSFSTRPTRLPRTSDIFHGVLVVHGGIVNLFAELNQVFTQAHKNGVEGAALPGNIWNVLVLVFLFP